MNELMKKAACSVCFQLHSLLGCYLDCIQLKCPDIFCYESDLQDITVECTPKDLG